MDPQTPQTTTPTFCASTQPDGILKNTDSPAQQAVSDHRPRMAAASVAYSNAINPCKSHHPKLPYPDPGLPPMTTEPIAPHCDPSPVASLLTLGIPEELWQDQWINYPAQFGLTLDHVPELIQLALSWNDDEFDEEEEDLPALYAPIHAWRALGQLQAEAAIEPLISLLAFSEDLPGEWIAEDLPQVFGLMGLAAVPALTNYLNDTSHPAWSRTTAAQAIVSLVGHHPELRSSAIATLTSVLAAFADNDPELNGFLVCYLLDLKAVESAPTMEQAFAAKTVDLAFAGDWDDVQVALGLKEKPVALPRRSLLDDPRDVASWNALGGSSSYESKKSKTRAKNKLAKQSRQKNRKKRK